MVKLAIKVPGNSTSGNTRDKMQMYRYNHYYAGAKITFFLLLYEKPISHILQDNKRF